MTEPLRELLGRATIKGPERVPPNKLIDFRVLRL
jgi:hypothetical protein